ncbi:MAG: N-acetylglucosamine-6-phosphate deacetylase [Prolixibacteraceae bacterium]|jgi:N-acetylglucosamine-6-phosphate deacetylase|nr:N-acetylglucosamine-6-phosphate deacetylase [Prolixibacteraceae bacterium]MBT6004490.1 N-acetylglucosamine-6-phosphate deacetylase [Prolixibacteraceae bacterium]MBT6765721.1 N-acetylglucosamine-6-phosphate deacetylase [Prolixibacteraceae bacterium]MBT6998196.1 N-acetylglucosamine-6-phosphate deacetylase [Prolixibacteraceae bacterium]MBT7393235.1 N-acetylglucosamine-6-phosphate deacetylase [Prolixibacteraceae bacterium]
MKKFVSLSIVLIVLFVGMGKAQKTIEGLHFATGNPVAVKVKDGKILEIKDIKKLSDEENNLIIAPGFFDNQINGFADVSFSFGGGELTQDGVRKATQALWERGVTSYLPTLTTNSREVLTKNFAVLAKAKDDVSLLGSIPGYHLEGPYISPFDGFRGAHSKRFVREPDWNEFMEFYEAAGKDILTVTVAPEIEGAMEFIKKCTDLGIVISLGHHNGTAQQINEAVQNGAKTCTHLGNGCANMINRHDNPLWPQLANDGLMISIICDGFHLRPEEIRVFSKAKGYDKTIVTSDVTKYAGLKPGIYKNIDGDDIELTVDGKIQYPAQQVLAGSASSIEKGIGHAMEVTGCTLAEAIGMASANPAKLYGLNDRGTLEVGKRADLVLLTVDDFKINVQKTFVKGELVYSAPK